MLSNSHASLASSTVEFSVLYRMKFGVDICCWSALLLVSLLHANSAGAQTIASHQIRSITSTEEMSGEGEGGSEGILGGTTIGVSLTSHSMTRSISTVVPLKLLDLTTADFSSADVTAMEAAVVLSSEKADQTEVISISTPTDKKIVTTLPALTQAANDIMTAPVGDEALDAVPHNEASSKFEKVPSTGESDSIALLTTAASVLIHDVTDNSLPRVLTTNESTDRGNESRLDALLASTEATVDMDENDSEMTTVVGNSEQVTSLSNFSTPMTQDSQETIGSMAPGVTVYPEFDTNNTAELETQVSTASGEKLNNNVTGDTIVELTTPHFLGPLSHRSSLLNLSSYINLRDTVVSVTIGVLIDVDLYGDGHIPDKAVSDQENFWYDIVGNRSMRMLFLNLGIHTVYFMSNLSRHHDFVLFEVIPYLNQSAKQEMVLIYSEQEVFTSPLSSFVLDKAVQLSNLSDDVFVISIEISSVLALSWSTVAMAFSCDQSKSKDMFNRAQSSNLGGHLEIKPMCPSGHSGINSTRYLGEKSLLIPFVLVGIITAFIVIVIAIPFTCLLLYRQRKRMQRFRPNAYHKELMVYHSQSYEPIELATFRTKHPLILDGEVNLGLTLDETDSLSNIQYVDADEPVILPPPAFSGEEQNTETILCTPPPPYKASPPYLDQPGSSRA